MKVVFKDCFFSVQKWQKQTNKIKCLYEINYMLKREKYLKNIRPFYEQDLVKVIIGIRRCGKSVILTQIIDELRQKGVKESQIIYINLIMLILQMLKN